MRYVLVSIVALLGAAMLSVPSYAEIDPDTIVAFWSFDDGAGKTAEDGSGNALDGNLVGDTEWIDGKVNKALTFDGLEDYVEVPDMLTPPLLTFACWFRRTGPGAGGVPRIHTSGGGPWAFEYGIGNTHQPNQLEFYFAFTDGSTAGWMAFFEPENDVWYHTAISYDGESVTAYVDGEEVYSNAQWAGKEVNQTISRIGGGALGDHFEGDIDEAIMLNVAVTENDVKDLMTGQWMAVDASGKITSTWGEIKNAIPR